MESSQSSSRPSLAPVLGQLRVDSTSGIPLQVPVVDAAGRDYVSAYHVYGCTREIPGDPLTHVLPVRIEQAYHRRCIVDGTRWILSTGPDLQVDMLHVSEEEVLEVVQALGIDELLATAHEKLRALAAPRAEEERKRVLAETEQDTPD